MLKKTGGWTAIVRRLSQLGFSAFIIISAIQHHVSVEKMPSTDALCPFGGIATLWRYISSGGTAFVSKTHPSNLVLVAGLLIGAIIAGGAFCGWVCPLGALQDALDWARRKLRLPEIRVPEILDRILRFGRYLVLAGILYATIQTARLWFADFCPYRSIFGLEWLFEFSWAEQWPAYVTALSIIAASLLIPRVWCRYLCPLGAILGAIQRISPLKVRRDAGLCISCGKCDRACPMKLKVATRNAVNFDCTGCQKCLAVCPVPGALNIGLGTLKPAETPIQEAAQ